MVAFLVWAPVQLVSDAHIGYFLYCVVSALLGGTYNGGKEAAASYAARTRAHHSYGLVQVVR